MKLDEILNERYGTMNKWEYYYFGRYAYLISACGDVVRIPCYISNGKAISLRKPKILKGTLTKKGYRTVELDGKAHTVHRLVALVFIPNLLKKEQINHKDGNKLNNNVENLEWCTNEENMRHAYNVGLQFNPFGKKARNFKYIVKCSEYPEWGELTALEMAHKINDCAYIVGNFKSCASNIGYRLHAFGLNFTKINRKVGEQSAAN